MTCIHVSVNPAEEIRLSSNRHGLRSGFNGLIVLCCSREGCEKGMNITRASHDVNEGDLGHLGAANPRRRTRVHELQAQLARLADTMRIAVIYSGDTNEEGAVIHQTYNPRSWKSYKQVAQDISDSLQRLGFRHVTTMPDDMRLGDRLRREHIDFAWLNTAGVQGIASASHASSMLEMFGIPYVGHNPLNAAILDNKHVFKRDLVVLGVPTSPFFVCQPWRARLVPIIDKTFTETFGDFTGPFVVKPVSGRASHHVSIAKNLEDLADIIEATFIKTGNSVLVEKFLSGKEYCISICGEVISLKGKLKKLENPFSFSIIERVLEDDELIFTSMDYRPITSGRVRILNPLIDQQKISQLTELAQRIYSIFDIETLIRLDVRADENENLYVLEANPKPDLAAPSQDRINLVCSGLVDEGMGYDDLIFSLIADRIDILFSRRRSTVNHLLQMLN